MSLVGQEGGDGGEPATELSSRQRALAFVQRFAAGDVDGLALLLAEDVRVVGPRLDVASRADYLAALRGDPPHPADARVLSVTDHGDTVAVFWAYEKPERAVTVAQLFRFRGARIAEMHLVFDTGTLA
jgi:hypothetical protein